VGLPISIKLGWAGTTRAAYVSKVKSILSLCPQLYEDIKSEASHAALAMKLFFVPSDFLNHLAVYK
jgi:hypothetical protein